MGTDLSMPPHVVSGGPSPRLPSPVARVKLIRQSQQVFAIAIFAQAVADLDQFCAADPAIQESNLFGYGNTLVLTLLDGLNETGSLHQAVVRPRVEPGEPAAQQLHAQIAAFQVAFVDRGDLQFTPGARFDVRSDADDIAVVEVQARHRPVRTRARRFFLDGGCPAGLVEGNYAIALWIANLVAEDRSSVLSRSGPVQLLRSGRAHKRYCRRAPARKSRPR